MDLPSQSHKTQLRRLHITYQTEKLLALTYWSGGLVTGRGQACTALDRGMREEGFHNSKHSPYNMATVPLKEPFKGNLRIS